MLPMRLDMENFGPYKKVTVDFNKFVDKHLFLISGKTGSGKTTIFDGICFALFGKTSGQNRTASQMRSLFANSNEKTKVSLLFEHQKIQYLVVREPSYYFLNKKGTMSFHESKNILEYHSSLNEFIHLRKKRDIDKFIKDLLHLNVDQFTQIVLLPQQKFIRFLSANSSEKEVVLRQVFGTELFQEWVTNIDQKVKKENTKLVKQKQEIITTISNINSILHINMNITNIDRCIRIISKWIDKIRFNLQSDINFLNNRELRLSKLNEDYQRLLKLDEYFNELEKIQIEKNKYNSQSEEVKKWKIYLDNLKWARNYIGDFGKLERQRYLLKVEREKISKLDNVLNELKIKQKINNKAINKLIKYFNKIDFLKKDIEILKLQLSYIDEIDKLKKKKIKENINEKYLTKSFLNVKKNLKYYDNNLKKIQNSMLEIKSRESEYELLKNKLLQLKDWKRDLHKLLELNFNLSCTNKKINVMSIDLKKNNNIFEELNVEINDVDKEQLLYYYANKLKDNLPCPLCGSLHHPNIFKNLKYLDYSKINEKKSKIKFYKDKINSIDNEIKELEKKRINFNKNYSEIYSYLLHKMDVPKNLSLDQISKLICKREKEILKRLQIFKFDKKNLSNYKKEYKLNENLLKTNNLKFEDIKNKLYDKKKKLIEINANLKIYSQKIHDDKEIIRCKITNYSNIISYFENKVEDLNNKKIKINDDISLYYFQFIQSRKKSLELEKNINDNKFKLSLILQHRRKSKNDFVNLISNISQIDKIQEKVDNYTNQISSINYRINYIRGKIAGRKRKNLKNIYKKIEQLKFLNKRVQEKIGSQKKELNILDKDMSYIKNIWDSLNQNQKKLNDLLILSDVLNGKGDGNKTKLTFERYVLREYFKEVLIVANKLLRKMTHSRYLFVLQKSADKNVVNQVGLGIDIYDDAVGKTRSVHTLSGGESFIASLALSLALGEVIQQKNGGVQIDILFIDEGFGSLDEDAINVAIQTLRSLEKDNRMIGIISHVKTIYKAIHNRIKVIYKNGVSYIKYDFY